MIQLIKKIIQQRCCLVIQIMTLSLLICMSSVIAFAGVSPWIGKSSAQLIRSWGTPNTKILLRNKQQILVYDRVITRAPANTYSSPVGVNMSSSSRPVIVMPMNTLNNFNQGNRSLALTCSYRFHLDAHGIIRDVKMFGSGCPN